MPRKYTTSEVFNEFRTLPMGTVFAAPETYGSQHFPRMTAKFVLGGIEFKTHYAGEDKGNFVYVVPDRDDWTYES